MGRFCFITFFSQITGEVTPSKTPEPTPIVAEEHFAWEPLFANGMEGWVVQDGKLDAWTGSQHQVSCISAGGGWLRTEKQYSDFNFKVEYRLLEGGNTGIGVRCPPEGNPTFTGLEIQLLDDSSEKYKDLRASQYTGSVYYQVAPSEKANINQDGEWNVCEIRCAGDELTIKINDQVVNHVKLTALTDAQEVSEKTRTALAHRPPLGHIALQSHTTQIDFRNAMVQDISQKTATGLQYVDLVEGAGELVAKNATVTIHYMGQLADGKRFTDSRTLGKPVTVSMTKVIDGWQEGITGMKVGGRRRLIVPPALAYGHEGVKDLIPPDSTLVFEVELCGFER